MKLYELVNKYHIGTDLSCAEAMFKACNEYYHLNLPDDTRKMFSVMGDGMQSGISCCGAYTVAVAMIGLFTAKENCGNVENEVGQEMIYQLTDYLFETFGSIFCNNIRELEINEHDDPCEVYVEAVARALEEIFSLESALHGWNK